MRNRVERRVHIPPACITVILALLAMAQLAQVSVATANQPAITPPVQSVPAPCAQVTAVSPEECATLVNLHTTTGGAGWINDDGWLTLSSPESPCDWYGVVCANGHVVELQLANNRLNGPVPPMLANLTDLEQLVLSGNRLRGLVPAGVCALTDTVATGDFSYNALITRRADVRNCMNQLDADWAATQTIAPYNAQVAGIEHNAVELSWTPIPYTADGGFYEISYATSGAGPYITHGRTADKYASSYRLDGLAPGTTYYVRVQTVTLAHPNNTDQLRSNFIETPIVTRADETILLMVYFSADNDLSPYIEPIAERLRIGSINNPNVQVVFLSDGNGSGDTQLVTIANGAIQMTNTVAEQWGHTELNTADPDVLSWFLRYARANYPATREIVSLMGHGLAMAPDVEWPEIDSSLTTEQISARRGIPPLPRDIPATPDDVTDRGYLSTIGLGSALAAATDGGATPFDLVFFDQCFQGNLDTLYEVRTAADFFIASPNYAWLVAPYDRYLLDMAPANSTEVIVDSIIERYQGNLNEQHPNVIFGLRRADIDTLATATSALGEALQRAVSGGVTGPISRATQQAKYVDTTQCGAQNLTLGPPDELIGLGAFVRNLASAFPSNERFGVRAATQQVEAALANILKSGRSGAPHIAPDEFWDYDNTVTILAPLPTNSPASVAWRSSIYTETVPLRATWSVSPTVPITVTGSFAYARDGSWDEFLATWYRTPLTPTVGEWCHYIPPAIVEGDDLEPLTLNAAGLNDSTVRLTWTPTTNEDVVSYVLYVKSETDIGWTARSILRPNRNTLDVDNVLADEQYHFLVIAQDALGVMQAQSNEVVW